MYIDIYIKYVIIELFVDTLGKTVIFFSCSFLQFTLQYWIPSLCHAKWMNLMADIENQREGRLSHLIG